MALRCGTVDGFQGGEADAVLVSFVGSALGRPIGGPGGAVGFVADARRLNVALTRARHALLLLGHAPTLEASGAPDVAAVVHDARDHGELVDWPTVAFPGGWK